MVKVYIYFLFNVENFILINVFIFEIKLIFEFFVLRIFRKTSN